MADWILVDRRSPLVRAWSRAFVNTDVHVAQADLVTAAVGSAWVSPANSFGWMDGGVDWVIAQAYTEAGCDIMRLVQTAIRDYAAGELPVGQALVIPTPDTPLYALDCGPDHADSPARILDRQCLLGLSGGALGGCSLECHAYREHHPTSLLPGTSDRRRSNACPTMCPTNAGGVGSGDAAAEHGFFLGATYDA